MSLKGNLQSVDLGNILQMLSINQKEGTLVLFDGDTKKSIYFSREGVSMLSRGRRGNDSLGRVLLRYGRVTPEQLEQALQVQEREGKRLGTVLEELGLATHDDIENAVRTQIEEEIYNLFIWENASFEFIEGPPPPALENLPARVTFNVNSLILEAQRRLDEWNYIRGLVPTLDEVYRPTGTFAEADIEDPVFHLPFAFNVLENLNQGRLNVSELIDKSYAGKFEVCKMLANLLEQGAVEPVPLSDLSALAAEATSRGDHPQAAKFLLRIVELGGATPQVNLSLGYALEAVEEPERASHYLKAAAEAYADAMQAQPAFDAYLRVARSLPTDLAAIGRMLEIACDHPPVMEAHRHEVVQTGRRVADCLKEVGKTTAAMKVLHRLSQSNLEDMALRGQLASLYVESNMPQEAVQELESMASVCAHKKSFEEAIRYLKKVLVIDRGRQGVLKRIEALGKARDRGKRLAMQVTLVVACTGAVAAGIWGYFESSEGRKRRFEEMNLEVEAQLKPGKEQLERAKAAVVAACEKLKDWRALESTEVAALAEESVKQLVLLASARTQNAAAADALWEKYKDLQDPGAKTARKQADDLELQAARTMLNRSLQVIAEQLRRDYDATMLEARSSGHPTRALPALRKVHTLASALSSLPTGPRDVKEADKDLLGLVTAVTGNISTIEGYVRDLEAIQAKADGLWTAGNRMAARDAIAGFLSLYETAEFFERLVLRVRVATTPRSAKVEVLRGIEKGDAQRATWPDPLDLRYTAAAGLLLRVSAHGFETREVEILPVDIAAPPPTEALVQHLAYLLRIDLQKHPVWTVPLGPGGATAPPVPLPGGGVVVGDRSGHVRVISEAGEVVSVWDADSPSGFLASPVVRDGWVYGATADGVVFGRPLQDLASGWRFGREDSRSPGSVEAGPAVSGDTLFVAGTGGTVVALECATGRSVWRKLLEDLPQAQGPRVPLLIVRGQVVAITETGELHCLRLADGRATVLVPSAMSSDRGLPPPEAPAVASASELKVLIPLRDDARSFVLVQIPDPEGEGARRLAGYDWFHGGGAARPKGAAFVPGGEHPDVVLAYSDGRILRFPLRPIAPPKSLDEAGIRILDESEKLAFAPVLSGSSFVVPAERRVNAVGIEDRGMRILWTWALPADVAITAAPVVSGPLVLVCTSSGEMHALLLAE